MNNIITRKPNDMGGSPVEGQEDGLIFLPLGGAGEIGMNLNLYGYNDEWIMVDMGVTFNEGNGVQVIAPDTRFIEENKDDLLGIVLTHAHEDHIGAIPHLWSRLRCPIYATPFTMEIVKNKLGEAGLLGQVELHTIDLEGSLKLGDFKVTYVHLTHSTLEPNGLLIETPVGRVFHTGDWKIDPDPMLGRGVNIDKLKQIGDQGVLAMVCDSTNVFETGSAGSEAEVRKALIDLVKEQKNRVVITCFASNLARLASCIEAARESGRFICFLGRSMDKMLDAATKTGYFPDIPFQISVEKAKDIPRDQILYVCTGSQGEPRAALNRIACGLFEGLRIDQNDTVIFSSRKIPGNEQKISAIKNELVQKGVKIINESTSEIHVSGHPSRGDLEQMYQWIRPKIAVPVHGEFLHLHEHGSLAKESWGVEHMIIPQNGSLILLSPTKPEILDRVHNGYLGRDGHEMIDMNGGVIRDRIKLSQAGVVCATVHINNANKKAYKVDVTFKGISEYGADTRELESILSKKLLDMMKSHPIPTKHEAKEEARLLIRRTINRMRGIKPIIILHVGS